MRDLAILFIHLIVTIVRLFAPGGTRTVVVESPLVEHPLLILSGRVPILDMLVKNCREIRDIN